MFKEQVSSHWLTAHMPCHFIPPHTHAICRTLDWLGEARDFHLSLPLAIEIDGAFSGDRQGRRSEPHRVISVRKLVVKMSGLLPVVEI